VNRPAFSLGEVRAPFMSAVKVLRVRVLTADEHAD
jgi:hypothetical protein